MTTIVSCLGARRELGNMTYKCFVYYIIATCGPATGRRVLLLLLCSSTTFSAQLTACLRDQARHFKTDPTGTVALCVGYPKTPRLRHGVFEPIDTVSTD
jgi:hypothetical protein